MGYGTEFSFPTLEFDLVTHFGHLASFDGFDVEVILRAVVAAYISFAFLLAKPLDFSFHIPPKST